MKPIEVVGWEKKLVDLARLDSGSTASVRSLRPKASLRVKAMRLSGCTSIRSTAITFLRSVIRLSLSKAGLALIRFMW